MKISDQLINNILGYLGTRPYQEVYQLIDAVQQEARDSIAPPPEPEKPAE
jgi:hypothetical protein